MIRCIGASPHEPVTILGRLRGLFLSTRPARERKKLCFAAPGGVVASRYPVPVSQIDRPVVVVVLWSVWAGSDPGDSRRSEAVQACGKLAEFSKCGCGSTHTAGVTVHGLLGLPDREPVYVLFLRLVVLARLESFRVYRRGSWS